MFDKRILTLPHIKRCLCVLAIFSLLEAASIVAQAIGLSRALVSLWEGALFTQVIGALTLFSCAFIITRLVVNGREAFIESYAKRCAKELRTQLLQAVFRTGAPVVQAFGTGSTAAMVLEGVDKTKNYLELVLPKLVSLLVLPLVLALVILGADWVSGIIVIILLPAMILLMNLIGRTTADRSRQQHATFKMMSNHFIDSVRGIKTINAFATSKGYADRVFAVSERFREATVRMLRMATLSGAVLDLFATLAIAAVSIMLGLRLIDGSLTLAPALFVLILAPEFFRPIREFASDYHASLDGVNSLSSIDEMIASASVAPSVQELPAWSREAELTLEGISRTYDDRAALRDISYTFAGTHRIGIIGTSGSGKSTLLRLLAGFDDPTQGSFELSSAAGAASLQLPTLRNASWQQQIAYIPQDPYLFHATLRENLTFYNPAASDQKIAEAIDALGLRELVEQLPEGLDTLIGEGGRGLSGGQAQRVALARVMLDEGRKIVLFDEPTAHLDIETEYELKEPMLKVMEGKLVIFATHRLHWLDAFDHVLVLEEGALVQQGAPDQLATQEGPFAQLIRALRGGEVA